MTGKDPEHVMMLHPLILLITSWQMLLLLLLPLHLSLYLAQGHSTCIQAFMYTCGFGIGSDREQHLHGVCFGRLPSSAFFQC